MNVNAPMDDVKYALAQPDYATAYQIINRQWIKLLLPMLNSSFEKLELEDLFFNLKKGVDISIPACPICNRSSPPQKVYSAIDPRFL